MDNNRKVINLIRLISLKFFNLYTYNQKTLDKINLIEFENYTKNNDISQRYKDLILNLDFKSKVVVDTLLYRSTQIKKLIFSYNLSSKEVKQAAKDTYYDGYVGEYDIEIPSHFYQNIFPGLTLYESSLFKFHHGLVFLDNKILNYLKDKDVIDGGSYNLESSIVLNYHYQFRNFYCFEIDPINYSKGLNILQNFYPKLQNIISINKGLWDSEGFADIKNGGNNSSTFEISNQKQNLSNLTSLDNFVNENNLNLGYIKIDIEGAEYNAIMGAKETIKKFLPIMSISIYHNFKDFFEIKPLIEKIAPGEYDFYIRKLAPFYSQLETYLICVPKKLNANFKNLEDIDIYG